MSASGPTAFKLEQLGEVRPTIRDPDRDQVVQPPIVTRVGGTLPLDTGVTQGTGGTTYVDQTGDMNVTFTMEGYLFRAELLELTELVRNAGEVQVITDGFTGFVNFTELKWDRNEQEQRGNYTFQGTPVTEPLYTFQLLQKENNQNKSIGQQVIDS